MSKCLELLASIFFQCISLDQQIIRYEERIVKRSVALSQQFQFRNNMGIAWKLLLSHFLQRLQNNRYFSSKMLQL